MLLDSWPFYFASSPPPHLWSIKEPGLQTPIRRLFWGTSLPSSLSAGSPINVSSLPQHLVSEIHWPILGRAERAWTPWGHRTGALETHVGVSFYFCTGPPDLNVGISWPRGHPAKQWSGPTSSSELCCSVWLPGALTYLHSEGACLSRDQQWHETPWSSRRR